VHDLNTPRALGIESSLSADQREALTLALDEGYFDVPRRINLITIADRLGISDSAASQRIRRGLSAVLTDLSFEEPGDGE
ncbi:MAG: helix-turn-helix domain-containing protein, partial [Halobacteriales archaeon]|nr:helix-turn-helix domain-containing protein [Halobacteriales archaeon]